MELDFDKEIDALLRKARAGKAVFAGERAGSHLDADEFVAFAENAMPENSRRLHYAHLAECDRCRKILSNQILLNSEAEPAAASPAVIAAVLEESIPWYRRLFAMPNLVYGMGALVLVFGGFLGFLVLQNSTGESDISQMSESHPVATGEGGPMASEESAGDFSPEVLNANANSSIATNTMRAANASANTAASVANETASAFGAIANTNSAPPAASLADSVTARSVEELPTVRRDSDASLEVTTAEPPAPAKDTKDGRQEQNKGLLLMKSDAQTEGEKSKKLANERRMREAPRTQAGGLAKPSVGPSRDLNTQQNQTNSTYDVSVIRQFGGRTFQQKDRVWYDNAYRGQATINVRRGTKEYKKLDSGLRSIAENLGGTVVVVWKEKVYRIQ